MASSHAIFGEHTETDVFAGSYFGLSGWWRVPLGWTVKREANNQVFAYENSDLTGPRYACKLNHAGEFVFLDLMRSAILKESRAIRRV